MGGSGSGSGGGRTQKPKSMSCGELTFNTQLSSPREDVIILLKVGFTLDIEISPNQTACVVIFEDKVAGTIIHSLLNQLISCIKSGYRYYARVRNVNGAKCSITVLPEILI